MAQSLLFRKPKRQQQQQLAAPSQLRVSAISEGNERNKLIVRPYAGMRFQNREGFLALDFNEFDRVNMDEVFPKDSDECHLEILQPLSYQLQKCTISEYEYDDYYWRKENNNLKPNENIDKNGSQNQTNQPLSENSQDVFVKILQIQQALLQDKMQKASSLSQHKQKCAQAVAKFQAVIDKDKAYLRESKKAIQKLKDEISDLTATLSQAKKALLSHCAYSCRLCPKKIFKTEVFLKQHMARRHPGMLHMFYGDLNYEIFQNIQELQQLMVKRQKLHQEYFKQEQQRVDSEISEEVLSEITKNAFEFKKELLEFQEKCIVSFDKRFDIANVFDEKNAIFQKQSDLLLEEFVKITEEIKEADDHCVKAYLERERLRLQREREELERLAREKREAEERIKKEKEEAKLLKAQRKQQKKENDERRRREKLGEILIRGKDDQDEGNELVRKNLLRLKQEEERRLKLLAEQAEQERQRIKKKKIKALKQQSIPMFDLLNYFVDNRDQGNKNYSDKEYDGLLSTQLFDKFNKLMSKYKITEKIDEITVKTSQVSQLESILQKVSGGLAAVEQDEASLQRQGKSKLEMLQEEKMKNKQEIDIGVNSNEEDEEDDDDEEEEKKKQIVTKDKMTSDNKIDQMNSLTDTAMTPKGSNLKKQSSILMEKKVTLTKNPLFKEGLVYRPYFQSFQQNPKYNNLQLQKEETIRNTIEVSEELDSLFSFRQNILAKNKSKIQIGEIKHLNKLSNIVEQNPLTLHKIF